MSDMLAVLDRITVTVFGAWGVLAYLALWPAWRRRAIGEDKKVIPPEIYAQVTPENRPGTRRLQEFKTYWKEDATPLSSRISMTPGTFMKRTATVLVPLILALSWVTPILGAVVSAALVGVAASTLATAWRRFIEVDQFREALLTRAFNLADTHVRYGAGAGQYGLRNWVKVTNWDGTTPEAFDVFFTEKFRATEDMRTEFRMQWEQSMSTQCSWGFAWKPSENKVTITPLPLMTRMAALPFPASHTHPWHSIPLGVDARGRTVHWDVKDDEPHLLIAGLTGKGKSVQLNAILLDVLQNPFWSVMIADRKNALSAYTQAAGVKRFEVQYESILDMVQTVQAENERRKSILTENGIRKWFELPDRIMIGGKHVDRPPMIMLVIEEAIDLLAKSGVKEVDAMKAEIKSLLLQLVATCRSQGIHIVMVIQRPDAEFMGGAFRTNMGGRLQVGPMKHTDSAMVLGESAPKYLMTQDDPDDPEAQAQAIKGRAAYANSGGDYVVFQGFFSKDDDDSLGQYLRVCNLLTEPGPGGRPRYSGEEMWERLHPKAKVPAPGEVADVPSSGRVGRLLGRVGLELVREQVQVDVSGGDDDDAPADSDGAAGGVVERTVTRVRRARKEQALVVDAGDEGQVDDRAEAIRRARERIERRRAEQERSVRPGASDASGGEGAVRRPARERPRRVGDAPGGVSGVVVERFDDDNSPVSAGVEGQVPQPEAQAPPAQEPAVEQVAAHSAEAGEGEVLKPVPVVSDASGEIDVSADLDDDWI